MGKFCKLFELPEDEQVAIYVETDDESEDEVVYNIVQVTDITDVCRGELKLGFTDENKRDEAFNSYNIDNAIKFRYAILQFTQDNL